MRILIRLRVKCWHIQKTKDEIYQNLLKIKPKEFSIEFTGEIPEDLAVVMVCYVWIFLVNLKLRSGFIAERYLSSNKITTHRLLDTPRDCN